MQLPNSADIKAISDYIKKRSGIERFDLAVILGSGLGYVAEEFTERQTIPYSDIPMFPQSTVKGHSGELVVAQHGGKHILLMKGRFHYYEGHAIQQLRMPIYVMKNLNVRQLIVTNAAGAVNESFRPGDLMIIDDQINFSLTNPLMGKNEAQFGPRFPDTSTVYHPKLKELAFEIAAEHQFDLKRGVYQFMTGPCYETPAEVRMARKLGADALGMSTVPEAIAAAHCSIPVLGVSYISNMGAGILDQPLDHAEVLENMELIKCKFSTLLFNLISRIDSVN